MKLSAWHKLKGDTVEWAIPMLQYDKVYISKVFTFTQDFDTYIKADEIVTGGTGYDLKNKLPEDIETIYPDYSLYNEKKAYGFLTRGCPRGCKFCIVSEKEGKISKRVADLEQFWNGQKEIIIMDPNLLACTDWKLLLQQLINSKSLIDINQGFDIRVMTDEKAYMVNQLKVKMLHFAWDNYEFKTYDKLKEFRNQFDFDFRKLRVYVLTNFNTTFEQDLERVYKLRELGYDPYVMIYEKKTAPKTIRKLQRWVNNKFIFRSCEKFENYTPTPYKPADDLYSKAKGQREFPYECGVMECQENY
jgi:hypothetical protein